MAKKLWYWISDYVHGLWGLFHMAWYNNPPDHYLGFIVPNRDPVILIPGILGTWPFLKTLGDAVSKRGHPVYIVRELGYNTKDIHDSTCPIRALIRRYDLRNVILIAHSKGGLIGKHLLAFHNEEKRVKKLIAIATPFAGSKLARLVPTRAFHELLPESENIRELQKNMDANKHIVSIFGTFDNHVWPNESSRLEGAKNVQLPTYGHHRILFDTEMQEAVMQEIH